MIVMKINHSEKHHGKKASAASLGGIEMTQQLLIKDWTQKPFGLVQDLGEN